MTEGSKDEKSKAYTSENVKNLGFEVLEHPRFTESSKSCCIKVLEGLEGEKFL